jgi:hypothetical protein
MMAIAKLLTAGQVADGRSRWNPEISQEGAELFGLLERTGNAVVLAGSDL